MTAAGPAPGPVITAQIDVVGRCNLQCIYCNEGVKANDQPQGALKLGEFRARYEGLLGTLRHLDLHNWSEPFLNREIFEIIDYAREQNPELEIGISTNGHALTDRVCERLVEGKVRNLTISISGLDNKVNGIYHVGSDLEKVLTGIERLLSAKERARSDLPLVRIRYLRFPFNFISRGTLRRFMRGRFGPLGRHIRSATVRDGYIATVRDDEFLRYLQFAVDQNSESVGGAVQALRAKNVLEEGRKQGKSIEQIFTEATGHTLVTKPYAPDCEMIRNSVTIRTDGTVFPCCIVPYEDRFAMGKVGDSSLEEIWNSPKYRSFRERFEKGTNATCNKCRLGYPVPPLKPDRHVFARLRQIWKLSRLDQGQD